MQYASFANPQWADPENDRVDVDLVLIDGTAAVRYTAGRNDAPSADLFSAILAKGGIAAYVAPVPSMAERAAIAMGEGLSIALSGAITLDATIFPIDPDTQAKIAAVITTINTTGSFPGAATSYPMKDGAGTWHTFTLAQYKAVAAAIAAYAAALYLIIDGNPLNATELPGANLSLTV